MFKMKLVGACCLISIGSAVVAVAGGAFSYVGAPALLAVIPGMAMVAAGIFLCLGIAETEVDAERQQAVWELRRDINAADREIERLRDALMGRHIVPADIVAMANGLEKLAVDIGHEAVAMLEKARALRDSMDGLGRHMDEMAQENDRLSAEAAKVREIATIATRPAPVQAPDIAPAGPAGAPAAAPSLEGRPEEFAPQAARREALAGLERTLMSTTAVPATGK